MEGFDLIRHRARLCHAEGPRAKAGGTQTAAAPCLTERPVLPGSDDRRFRTTIRCFCGAEAVLDRSTPAIFYKQSVGAADAVFYQAHEFAHYWLDSATGACAVGEIDDSMPEERIPLGIQRVDGYGPREERRECRGQRFCARISAADH